MRISRKIWMGTLALGFLASCSDQPSNITNPSVTIDRRTQTTSFDARARFREVDRKDTPWARMSDDELERATAEANGRVLIGFKNAEALEGCHKSGPGADNRSRRFRGA